MSSVGDRIRQAREGKGWTQDRLSQEAGISKGFLSDVENGKRDISSENLLKVANALGASLDYLLRGKTKEEQFFEPVVIPPELRTFAEQERLKFSETVELLEAHKSIVARRGDRSNRNFTVGYWKELYKAIRKVFDQFR